MMICERPAARPGRECDFWQRRHVVAERRQHRSSGRAQSFGVVLGQCDRHTEASRVASQANAVGRYGFSTGNVGREALLNVDQEKLTAGRVHEHGVFPSRVALRDLTNYRPILI